MILLLFNSKILVFSLSWSYSLFPMSLVAIMFRISFNRSSGGLSTIHKLLYGLSVSLYMLLFLKLRIVIYFLLSFS